MSKLAIREELLPGATVDQRLAAARELGFDAVEFPADDLDDRIDEIDDALRANGMAASGVNMCAVDGWVSADIARRNQATNLLRQALTCALDLESEYVTFAPQIGASDMPDLTPFASPMELQKELLIWLLRGFSDLADAMDSKLAIKPLNHAETAFLTRLDQAAFFCRAADDHPMITLAADVYHLALERTSWLLACARITTRSASFTWWIATGSCPAVAASPSPPSATRCGQWIIRAGWCWTVLAPQVIARALRNYPLVSTSCAIAV